VQRINVATRCLDRQARLARTMRRWVNADQIANFTTARCTPVATVGNFVYWGLRLRPLGAGLRYGPISRAWCQPCQQVHDLRTLPFSPAHRRDAQSIKSSGNPA